MCLSGNALNRQRIRTRGVALAAAIALLAGCSGSPSATLPTASNAAALQPAARVPVDFVIRVPKRNRRSHFIAPSTKSMSIAITFAGKSVLKKTLTLTPNSPGCKPVAGGTQCTVSVALGPKNGYIASIDTYDGFNGTGKLLSIAQDVAFTVKVGKKNQVSLTLSGVPAQIVTTKASATSFTVVAKDADGETIVGAGAPSFTASKTSGSTVVSIVQPTKAAPNTVTVALASPRPVDGSTETIGITASYAFGLTNACTQGGAVCTRSDAVTAQAPRQVIIVGSYAGGYTSSASGNVAGFEIPFSSSTPAPAYAMKAKYPFVMTADAAGNIFVPGYSSSGPLYEFSPPYGSAAVTNTNAAFNTSRGAALDSHGNIFIGNNGASTVSEIEPPYTGAPALTLTSTSGISAPQGIAVDTAHGDTLYVGNGSALGVYESSDYTTEAHAVTLASSAYDGMLIANGKLFVGEGAAVEIFTLPIANNTPTHVSITQNLSSVPGVAVDASGNLFVANFGNSQVMEYKTPFSNDESPAAVIATGLNGPWSLCFDALGNLYVVNTVGESGHGSITQFAPPFSNSSAPVFDVSNTLADPYGAAIVPPVSNAVTLSVP